MNTGSSGRVASKQSHYIVRKKRHCWLRNQFQNSRLPSFCIVGRYVPICRSTPCIAVTSLSTGPLAQVASRICSRPGLGEPLRARDVSRPFASPVRFRFPRAHTPSLSSTHTQWSGEIPLKHQTECWNASTSRGVCSTPAVRT